LNATHADNLTQHEVTDQLQAAVAARHEMGADMEEHVLEVFLARVQQRIDAQVAQQMEQNAGSKPRRRERTESAPLVVAGSLGIAIPLMGIAGETANGVGIFIVMAGVVLINTLYFIDRWVRFNTQ
jgi:hypothetical protein